MASWFRRLWGTAPSRSNAKRQTQARLECEALEDRVLLSVGNEFHVNSLTTGDQAQPATASSANGMTVVVWSSQKDLANSDHDIKAQLYSASKSKICPTPVCEIVITDVDSVIEKEPAVAMDDNGNFVVVWTTRASDNAADRQIVGARFNANGVRLGGFTVANSALIEYDPAVARAGNGDFVVSYIRPVNNNFTNKDAFAKMFTNAGTFIKTLILGNSGAEEEQSSVARASDGRFSIAYQVGANIHLRRYDAGGNQLTVQGVAGTANTERYPSVAINSSGTTAVVWEEVVGAQTDIIGRKVFSNASIGSRFTVRNSANNETKPVIAIDRSDSDMVVTYQVGSGTTMRTGLTELAADGSIRSHFDLGASRGAPAISITGQDRYMVVYAYLVSRPDDPDQGIYGRFGVL